MTNKDIKKEIFSEMLKLVSLENKMDLEREKIFIRMEKLMDELK